MEYKRSPMKKLYIFCIPTLKNIQILKNLYFLLASGCKMVENGEEFAVRPVFIMQKGNNADKALQDLEQMRVDYDKIHTTCFIDTSGVSNFFRARIVEAATLSNTHQSECDRSVEMLKLLFQHDNQAYSKGLEWEQLFRSSSPNAHVRISEQDKVLFLLPADQPEQMVLAKLLFEKKWVKKAGSMGLVVDMSCRNPERIYSLLSYGLLQLTNECRKIFIPDTGKYYFDSLQAAVAIVDFSLSSDHAGLLNERRVTEYYQTYNISDLSNVDVRNSLVRFFLFSNLVSNKYLSEISSWQKHFDFSRNGIENPHLERVRKFAQLYLNWISEIKDDFRLFVSANNERIQLDQSTSVSLLGIFRYLNNLSPTRVLNNAERGRNLVLAFADSVYQVDIYSNSGNKEKYLPYSVDKSADLPFLEWKQIPNPFTLFMLYEHSFIQCKDSNFLQQRSFCLDMWELFFCMSKNVIEKFFEVDELVLKTYLDGHYCDVLNKYDEYSQVLADSMEVLYLIKDKENSQVVAYSSPYTGFCVRHGEINPVTIDTHTFFSANSRDWKELRQRSEEFRVFMKRYVNLAPALSQSFVKYVTESLSLDERVKANAENFFDSYSQFRHHIPVFNK